MLQLLKPAPEIFQRLTTNHASRAAHDGDVMQLFDLIAQLHIVLYPNYAIGSGMVPGIGHCIGREKAGKVTWKARVRSQVSANPHGYTEMGAPQNDVRAAGFS